MKTINKNISKECFENLSKKAQIELLIKYYEQNYSKEESEEANKKYETYKLIYDYIDKLTKETESFNKTYKMNEIEESYDNYITKYINNEQESIEVNHNELVKSIKEFKEKYAFGSTISDGTLEDICAYYTKKKEFITPSQILEITTKPIKKDYYKENINTRYDMQKEYLIIAEKRIKEIIEHGVTNHKYYNYLLETYRANFIKSIGTVFTTSKTIYKTPKEEEKVMKSNATLLTILLNAENEIEQNIGLNIVKQIQNKLKFDIKEKQKLKKEEQDYKNDIKYIFFARNFLVSDFTKEAFCSYNGHTIKTFNQIMEKVKEQDEELYNKVMQKILVEPLTQEEENNLRKQFKDYLPTTSNLNCLDFVAITNRPIGEVEKYFKQHDDKEMERSINKFFHKNKTRMIPMNYEEEKQIKTIINERELKEEDIDNIKNFIEEQGYQHLKGVYLIVRNNYVNGTLENITKENILKGLEVKAKQKQRTR